MDALEQLKTYGWRLLPDERANVKTWLRQVGAHMTAPKSAAAIMDTGEPRAADGGEQTGFDLVEVQPGASAASASSSSSSGAAPYTAAAKPMSKAGKAQADKLQALMKYFLGKSKRE